MTAIERERPERPTTKTPTGWDRKKAPVAAVSAVTLIAVAAVLVTWGLVPSPKDYVRADAQAVVDQGQNEKLVEIKADLKDLKRSMDKVLERLPSRRER